jgi:hypothetical protein
MSLKEGHITKQSAEVVPCQLLKYNQLKSFHMSALSPKESWRVRFRGWNLTKPFLFSFFERVFDRLGLHVLNGLLPFHPSLKSMRHVPELKSSLDKISFDHACATCLS